MLRIVLAGSPEGLWRIYRQEQWMAEVRRDPSATGWWKIHYDVEQDNYRALIEAWDRAGHGSSRSSAMERLADAGAVEVKPR